MKINILNLIDFEEVNKLLEGFNQSTGFVTAILDLEGNILSKSGWRQICTEFHRIHPDSSKNCTISDTVLANKLGSDEKYHFYECLNGLVDVAVPIIIKGEHVANLFSGQFFFEKPNRTFFEKQAKKFDFDKEEYLKALDKVPVVSKEQVKVSMDFLLDMTQLISEISYQKMEQLQLNEALKESEFRFNKLYENGPFGMVMTNKEFQFTKANPAFCSIMGYSEAELLNLTFKDISHPDDLHKDILSIQKLIHNEIAVYKTEKRYIRKDKQVIWGSLTVTSNFDSNGNFLYNLGIIEDITQRKHAEEEIALLNERISTATRSSQVGIWDWDVQNNLLKWDEQMYALYGLKKGEFAEAYEAWINGIHPDDRAFCQNEVQLALQGKKDYDLEFRMVLPDGTVRYVKGKGEVLRNEKGEPVRMVGINLDITEQKKKDEKIREKDLEFRKLSANVPDLIYQFTRRPDGSYFVPIASEGIINIFGCTPEDVAEDFTSIGSVLYPEDTERIIREIEYSAEHLTHFTCEFRVQIPGRDIQWIYSNSTPERLPDGSVTWYGFNVDITEKKLAEETLRYNASLLREVGQIAQVGGWDFNPLTGYSTWTEQVAIIHDLDPDTPASVQLSINYYSETSRPIIEKAFREVVELAKPYDLELDIYTAKGNHKWVRTIGRPVVENGQVIRVLGSFQDITERKLAEDALRESEEEFRMLLESIPMPVAYSNMAGEIVFRNERFLQVIGYTMQDVPSINEWWLNACPDESYRTWAIQNWKSSVQQAEENHTDIKTEEYRITCKNGAERIFLVTGILINDNLLNTFVDITARKKAEHEVKKLNETLEQRVMERTAQLEAANNELEAFSYSVSHDLRAPLRHISGYVDLLNNKFQAQLPENAQHYLSTITRATKQMGTLIDDLLEFSRTGRQELHQRTFDMNVLFAEALEKITPDFKNREIKWSVQNMPVIVGDYALLKQVWVNLLDNAVKYTKFVQAAEISVKCKEEKGQFVFYVKDNGVGFDMKYASKLFGVFQRLHSQADFEGTGIGLANVQRIIHKHNGKVWAEAEPNKGATFFFSLPK